MPTIVTIKVDDPKMSDMIVTSACTDEQIKMLLDLIRKLKPQKEIQTTSRGGQPDALESQRPATESAPRPNPRPFVQGQK